jgi:hypothetical protein
VHLLAGQAAQLARDVLVRDARGFLQRLALDHLGQDAARGDGAAAAEGLELGLGDAAVGVQPEARRSASPQAIEPTSPTPSASARSPTFRGLRKWSMTFSE